MSSPGWLHDLRFAPAPRRGRRHHKGRDRLRAATHRLNLEVLEDRVTPSFSPATSFPVGTSPQAVATADFNNDGRLDLATSNYDQTTGGGTVIRTLGARTRRGTPELLQVLRANEKAAPEERT